MSLAIEKTRRALVRSSLEVLVLSILAGRRWHGYAIGHRLAEATGQNIGPGTLYPLLNELEGRGWVVSQRDRETGRERRRYELTDAGRARLRSAATDWQAGVARMQAVILPALRHTTHHPHPRTGQSGPSATPSA